MLVFAPPLDPAIMREAKARLSSRYQALMQEKIDLDLHLWSSTGLTEWGDEVFDHSYLRSEGGAWDWTYRHTTMCSTGWCRFDDNNRKLKVCEVCARVSPRIALFLGILLLYDAGYFQTVVISEAREPRSYLVNPSGRTTSEQERSREVAIRRIRKNVLVKELTTHAPVITPRGSWLARHLPGEIAVKKKVRHPYKTRTRSGNWIEVTPTQPKRIPVLKKNLSAREVIELYAEPPTTPAPGEPRGGAGRSLAETQAD